MKRIRLAVLALVSLVGFAFLPAGPANAVVATVCANNMPAGFVKINDHWSPTSCGNPTSITMNVWTVESHTDKPVGSIMTVCANQQPEGWVVVNTHWSPTSCGRPTSIRQNVWTIERLV